MEDRKPESKPKEDNMKEGTPFKKKSLSGKALFVCQIIVMVVSGGFVFPHILD
jgi:hypothetical protein